MANDCVFNVLVSLQIQREKKIAKKRRAECHLQRNKESSLSLSSSVAASERNIFSLLFYSLLDKK
jgi:hypothetical protein